MRENETESFIALYTGLIIYMDRCNNKGARIMKNTTNYEFQKQNLKRKISEGMYLTQNRRNRVRDVKEEKWFVKMLPLKVIPEWEMYKFAWALTFDGYRRK